MSTRSTINEFEAVQVLNSLECRVNGMSAEMTLGSERQKAITSNVSERVEALASVVDKVVCDTMHATKTASQALAVANGLSRVGDGCASSSRDEQEMLLEAKFKAFEGYCEEMISSQCSVQREQLLKVTHSMNVMGNEFMKNIDRFGAELADHRQQFETFCADTNLCLRELPCESLREISANMRTLDERTSVIESILKRMTVRIAAFDRIIGPDSRPLPILARQVVPITGEAIARGSRVEAEYQDSWYNGTVVKLPDDDKAGRRYGVQCDVDDEGKLTYTSKVRLKEPAFSPGVEDLIAHSSSTCSGSTKVCQQLQKLDTFQTTDESMAEARHDDVATIRSKEPARESSAPSRIVPRLPLSTALGRVPLDEKLVGHEEDKFVGRGGVEKPERILAFAAHEKMKPSIEVASSQVSRHESPLGRRKAAPKMRERPRSHSPVVDSQKGVQQPHNHSESSGATTSVVSLAMAARGVCGPTAPSSCSTETASPPVSPIAQNLSPSELAPGPMQAQSPKVAPAAAHSHHLDVQSTISSFRPSSVQEQVATQMCQIEGRLDQQQPLPLGQPTSFTPGIETVTNSLLQESPQLAVVFEETPETIFPEVSSDQVDQLSPELSGDLKAVADAKASAAVAKAVEDVMTSQLDQHQKELQSWWVERKEVAGRIAADLFGSNRGAAPESPTSASREAHSPSTLSQNQPAVVASKMVDMAGVEDQRRSTSALAEKRSTSLSAIVSFAARGMDIVSDLPSTGRSLSPSTQVSMRVRSRSPEPKDSGFQSVVLAKFIEPVPTHGGEQPAPARDYAFTSRTVVERIPGVPVTRNKILESSGKTTIGLERCFSLPVLGHEPLDATRKIEIPRIVSSERRSVTPRRPSPTPASPGMREFFAPPPQASVVPSFRERRSPSPFRVNVPLALACTKTVLQRSQPIGASNVLNHSPPRRLPQARIRTASPMNSR